MVYYVMAIVLVGVSILFFTNKGDLVIPGAETMTAEQIEDYKKEYNVNKLTNIGGSGFLVIGILIGISGYINKTPFIIVSVAISMIVLTVCLTLFKKGMKN